MSPSAQEQRPDFIVGNYFNKHQSRNPVVKWIMRRYREALYAHLNLQPGESVLEIGCGEGELLQWLHAQVPTARLTGIDLEPWVYAETQRRFPALQFVAANGSRLPFENQSFDKVICCEVLEHTEQPTSLIEEARRVARSTVVFSVPHEPFWRILNMARGCYWRDWGNTPGHIQHWSSRAFSSMVTPHFSDVRYFTSAIPFIFAQARISKS